MKKFLSFLSFIIICALIAGAIYLFPNFFERQVHKIQGIYYVYKGDKAYRKMKLQKAIDYYNRGLALYPQHYSAWCNLGNLYVVFEDYYSAVDAYEQAIEHNPKFVKARMNYGIVSAEKLGDFDGAIDQYNSILNTKRHLLSIPFIYNNRRSTKINKGRAYYNMGIAYKQKSIYIAQDDWEYKHKYLTDALNAYKKAVKILKKDYDARYNLALTYHLLGDYHNAGLTYCKAIQLAPMSYEAHYNLAVLLRHLKYYKESLDEMEKATSLITDSEGSTNRQRYIFDIMNDVTKKYMTEKGESYFVEALNQEQLLNNNLTYVNGRLVSSDELDKTMLKNMKTCGSKKIFLEDIDEDYVEAQDRGRVFLPPME